MSNDNVVCLAVPESGILSDPLSDLLRLNARHLIGVPVAAEFEEYLSAFGEKRLPDGRLCVVRNGCLPERKTLAGISAGETGNGLCLEIRTKRGKESRAKLCPQWP